jgi:uncharacterized protein YjbI with pentapeptide repeats
MTRIICIIIISLSFLSLFQVLPSYSSEEQKHQEWAGRSFGKIRTNDDLKNILENHKKWLNTDKKEGAKANLGGANLNGAPLARADLREAILFYVDLRKANLFETNLSGAFLSHADLSGTVLDSTDFRGAYMRGINLKEAILLQADLGGVDLTGADLSGAIFQGDGAGPRQVIDIEEEIS